MASGEDASELSADAVALQNVRAYLRDEFNRAIRFPDMYGGETAANRYLYALEVAHGHDRAAAEMHGLRARGIQCKWRPWRFPGCLSRPGRITPGSYSLI